MQHEIIKQLNKSLNETGELPEKVELHGTTLRKSSKLRKFLNTVFGSDTMEVVYDANSECSEGEWDMSGCKCIIITKKGKVVVVTNSEWGRMSCVGALR